MPKVRDSHTRRTLYMGNWPYALRPIPGRTKAIKRPAATVEIPEEPIEVHSTHIDRYTIRYRR